MDEVTSAPVGGDEPISVEQAVAQMQRPEKPRAPNGQYAAGEQNNEPATSDESGAAEPELGDEPNAAQPPEAATSEDEGRDPAEVPPLDLPRSWSKDRADHWAKLDRETQEFLLDHDSKASAEVRRAQNEAAERNKANEAERQAYEQARQQYETQLPVLLSTLQSQYAQEFQDIQTWEDLSAMQAQDPIRYQRWDLMQKQAQAVQAQVAQAQQRQAQDEVELTQRFMQEETEKFLKLAPEYADPAKAPKLASEAKELFADIGVSQDELVDLWQHGKPIRIADHRVQLIIRDAMRYRAGQKALKNAAPKPVPPVQRPGTASTRGEGRSAQLETLETRLNKTHSVDDAVALVRARRRA